MLLACFLLGICPARAQGWKSLFRIPRIPAVSSKTIPMVQRRALVNSYSLKVNNIVNLNRLNWTAAELPVLERSVRNYYKTVSLRFPELSVRPMNAAANTLEDMALSLPASIKTENVFIEQIPAILKPREAYLAALMADAWGNWLESGIASQPPAEMVPSRADLKHAQALSRDLSAHFDKLYAALPAEQKDLSAQLSRVMQSVQAQTGWDDETVAALEQYFAGVMRSMITKQDKLTACEFLQAYDVLAVAAELPARYRSRMAKGASSLPQFLMTESIQRVRRRLVEGFIPSYGSAREQRLKRWYEGLFGREKF